jgi:methyltransferase (TIGR00027 family)
MWAEEPAMLKELKRLVCQVENVEAARDWYARVLGDEPAFDSPVACIFRVGASSLSLAKASAPTPDPGRLSAYWEVDDVDQTFARLLELGAQAKSPPANVLTLRVAQVTDPFGNVIGLSGRIPHDQQRTIESQPSETAHAVALCRALLARDERPELRRPDPFSQLFLKDEVRPLLDDAGQRQALIDRRISRPLYGYFAARSAFIDEAFVRALRQGMRQIVLLGAGYDTRALRFAAELGGTRIFEVDAPSTQGRKLALLATHGTAAPAQVCFVAVNFKSDDFSKRLRAAGYDETLATLFIWEGVTYYLPREAVEQTLALVHRHSAPGSAVVLDYMTMKLESINAGEPFLSFVEPEALPGWLEQLGFRVVDHLDATEMASRYLTLRDGLLAEKPLSRLRLVFAERRDD